MLIARAGGVLKLEASRLAPTPKPITISGSSRTRSDCSGMRSGCSGERKCRYGSSHSPDLKSGTFERAAPTAADPKEKLPSASVEGCFGDGSRSRIGNPKRPGSAPETSGRDCPIPTGVAFLDRRIILGALQIPTGVAFPAPGRAAGLPCRICSNTAVDWEGQLSYWN